jgi:ribosomal protein L39E
VLIVLLINFFCSEIFMTETKPSVVQKRPQINHALFLFDKKTAWMQRLADLARYGYMFHIQGQIPREKAYFMAEKFASFYGTGLGRMEQSRLRKQGQATFRFLAWHDANADIVHWVLLRTDGAIPEEATREKWRSLIDDRLVGVASENGKNRTPSLCRGWHPAV